MNETGSGLRLAALFVDHLVLQRGVPVPVWGWDEPGCQVVARLVDAGESIASARGEVGAGGRFLLSLPAVDAGGPYELVVEGSTALSVRDVHVGDVWLASGQSNMEWTVASSRDADREVAEGDQPQIRHFKVAPRAVADGPSRDVEGAWRRCSPDSVVEFSAVAHAFARELHESQSVAVGIVDATWGGTRIEAWMSQGALAPVWPDLPARLSELQAQLAALPEVAREYERELRSWQRAHLPSDVGNRGLSRGWAASDHDDDEWSSLPLPGYWQRHGLAFNGVVWFRTALQLPGNFAGQELCLSLGAVDDFDQTYFEGELVGETPPGTPNAHQLQRSYRVPAEKAVAGRVVIAVRVFDHFGDGGFAGPRSSMFLARADGRGERLPLSGPWKYRVEREIPLVPGDVFATAPAPPLALALQNAPAALYHGMISPLVPYALRGVIWYQGESNVEDHARYRALQVALMRDWRTRFGQGLLPFYYVQLASYRASDRWPLLREAQAAALSEPATGMVVSIDIGDSGDIHPKNKREVGRRLSLLARARAYAEPGVESGGPELCQIVVRGRRAQLRFARARGLRTRDAGPVRGFAVATSEGGFVEAHAEIAGEEVVLEFPDEDAPRAVRYAWADDPDANLENDSGLPAAPFRSDGFER